MPNNFSIYHRINIYAVKNELFTCWRHTQPFTIVIRRHFKF